jgi:hypothetical protein
LIALLALQPELNCSARRRQALVIAAAAELGLINGVWSYPKFDGEHNAMPTPVAAQAALLTIRELLQSTKFQNLRTHENGCDLIRNFLGR